MKRDAERAKAYQRKKYFISLFHIALEIFLLVLLISTGITFLFKRWTESATSLFYLRLTLYYALFFLTFWVVEFFLALYSDFRLEHTYGLSNQNFGAWAIEMMKKTLLSFVLSLLLILGLYFLIRHFPNQWWIGAWLGFAGVSYLLGQLFPVLIVPLFYKYGRVEDEALKQRIFNLVKRFNLPLENVYSLNLSKTTKKANAMFAGLGRTKRLVLADTLIQNFNVDEIESVVAHELGHFKHHDIWLHLGFDLVTSFTSFALAFYALQSWAPPLGYSGAGDLAAFPLLCLVFFLFGTFLTPLSNAYSRWREREADRFALKATGPAGFIPAMEKLAELNLADPDPHPLIVGWFYTHPPIAKRIRMAKNFLALLLILFLPLPPVGFSKEAKESEDLDERAQAAQALETRGRTEILNYFLGRPQDASGMKVPIAIDLYNQAVEFYEKREFELARQALGDSLGYDPKNPFAHELLGDIAYYEQKMDEALEHYEAAFRLRARSDLKEKILKIQKEKKVEAGLKTYQEEHFIIKYRGEEQGIEGFELRETLRNYFREVGQDLGFFFKHKVVVLLYDEKEFREISEAPHWSSGVYDGKIRLPAYQRGFSLKEIQKIIRHEVTHAFVVEMSRGKCPAWLNEGLAEYEEAKVVAPEERVFRAAIKTNALLPLSSLFDQKRLLEVKDPLEAQLFYVESYQLVNYLVKRYGMFPIKKMLEIFAQGKDSFEAVQAVLKISPLELEKQWKENLKIS